MAAGGAVIGALRVVLGADSADFETGLKGASMKLDAFGASIAKVGAAAAAAFTVALGGVAVAVKGSIDDMDKLGKLGQSVGMPVEELSGLKHAADLSGVSIDDLGTSIKKLGVNMSAVAGGATNEAAQAFKAMGVNVKGADGTLRSIGDLLGDVAEKFAGYSDGAAKTALAVAVFGRNGAALIPMLNGGRDGLREATEEARKLGLTFGKDTTVGAELFNDSLTRLARVKDGIVTQTTTRLVPALAELAKSFATTAADEGMMRGAVDGLTSAIKAAVSVAVGGAVAFQRIGAELSALWSVLTAANWEDFKAAWGNFTAEGDKTDAAFKSLGATIEQFWANTGSQMNAGVTQASAQALKLKFTLDSVKAAIYGKPDAPTIATGAKNALQSFIDGLEKQKASLQANIATFGMGAGAQEAMTVKMQAAAVALAAGIPLTGKYKTEIDGLAASMGLLKDKIAGQQLFEQTRTPAEAFSITMEDLNRRLYNGSMNWDLFARGAAKAKDALIQANPYAQALGNSLTSAFDKAIQGGTKLSDVLKGLLQDLGRALANQAFKSLLFGNASAGGTSNGIIGGTFGCPAWGCA
jgi:ribosomal protein L12E/L44/L45/RPP1/RPP2